MVVVGSSVIPYSGLTAPAAALTLEVNSTRDSSDASPGDGLCDTGDTNSQGATECTLRAAVSEANALAGADTISFNIPTTESGYSATPLSYTLSPTSSGFGTINDTVTIDGTTQPDFPGTPIVVLDGSGADDNDALTLNANNNVVRGLVINGWGGDGISVNSNGNTIQRNYIGTDVLGTTAVPNVDGIHINDQGGNLIGGIGQGNVISGNSTDGILIIGASSTGNVIQGNYLGTDATSTTQMGNGQAGFVFTGGASNNLAGGSNPGEGNVIANHTADGIEIQATAGSGNAFIGNEIYNNGGLGIDLAPAGITPNDPGDGDTGPNDLLNYPVVTAAGAFGGNVAIDFDLDLSAGDYRIEFFRNPGAQPEGEVFVGFYALTHPGGAGSYTTSVSGSVGDLITATATIDASTYGSTSEFSAAFTAIATAPLIVNSTGDGSDATLGDGLCDTGGLNSQLVAECTLRAAIEEANFSANADDIQFNMPVTEPAIPQCRSLGLSPRWRPMTTLLGQFPSMPPPSQDSLATRSSSLSAAEQLQQRPR